MPSYSQAARDDALFHYTSADGLIGILGKGELWSTAYYCTNDDSEFSAGRGVLTREFERYTRQLIEKDDPLVQVFRQQGIDLMETYAKNFEQELVSSTESSLCAYISCFCMANGPEDFGHGLLSQWRAYGTDGGYALQFSKKKLQENIKVANQKHDLGYDLQDVHYNRDNPLKDEMLSHSDAFLKAYHDRLVEVSDLVKLLKRGTIPGPLRGLIGGPFESMLDYFVYTKNEHFSEERECRLSYVAPVSRQAKRHPVHYFNRGGLVVPYTKTPADILPILDCIEWIVVGPSPRIEARFRSIREMVRSLGLEIKVRPSHIPFVRV